MYTLYNISITKIILETVSNKLRLKLKILPSILKYLTQLIFQPLRSLHRHGVQL